MKPNDRQKMCSNCDGRIPIEALSCPYCGSEQSDAQKETQAFQGTLFKHQALQDSLTSLYTPPYAARTHTEEENKKSETYKEVKSASSIAQAALPLSTEEKTETEQTSSGVWPIIALSAAGNLLTLGLLQLLFSHDGMLKLQWDSSYWFIYCLAAAPLFYFGLKKKS